jgi:hypothetical protein
MCPIFLLFMAHAFNRNLSDVLVEWLEILLRIRELLASIFVPEIGCGIRNFLVPRGKYMRQNLKNGYDRFVSILS